MKKQTTATDKKTSAKLYAQFICRLLLKWPTLGKLQRVKPDTLRNFFYGQNLRGDHIETKLELPKANMNSHAPSTLEFGQTSFWPEQKKSNGRLSYIRHFATFCQNDAN